MGLLAALVAPGLGSLFLLLKIEGFTIDCEWVSLLLRIGAALLEGSTLSVCPKTVRAEVAFDRWIV